MMSQGSNQMNVHRGPRAMGKKSPLSSRNRHNHPSTKTTVVGMTGKSLMSPFELPSSCNTSNDQPTVQQAQQSAPSSPCSAFSRRDSISSLPIDADPIEQAYAYHRCAAAELNNCAVALLEAAQPREAVETFGEAIRASKRAHAILESRQCDDASEPSDLNDSSSSFTTCSSSADNAVEVLGEDITESCDAKTRAHVSLDYALLQKRNSKSGEESSSSTVQQRDALQRGLCGTRGLMAYTQPLRLDASQANLCHQDSIAARLSTGRRDLAVIMFNMALVHHIRGCETSSEKSFKKALMSYTIAHSVFCKSRASAAAASSANNDKAQEGRDDLLRTALLNLALLNNMGQIISELGQEDVARQYFDGLSRLIADGTSDNSPSDAVKRCWDGFEMNVLFSLSCPSPAA